MRFVMAPCLRALLFCALVPPAFHISHVHAETIYQVIGNARVPWTPASGKQLQPPFRIRIDADVAGSRHIVPDFVANGMSTMRLTFSYPNDDQRVRGLDAIGCGMHPSRRISPVPLRVRVYALGGWTPTLISDTRETESNCEGWTTLDTDLILGELKGLVDGRHYAIVLDTLVRHPEFKAQGIDVYFRLSTSHHK